MNNKWATLFSLNENELSFFSQCRADIQQSQRQNSATHKKDELLNKFEFKATHKILHSFFLT